MILNPSPTINLPEQLIIADDEVHIWQIATQVADDSYQHLQGLLSADEHERANKYIFERDQRRFSIARGSLRQLLARYLACLPNNISFTQNEHGKPAIVHNNILEFNVSHSHELILIAISAAGPVGIDIEYRRADIDAEAIAKRFFSNEEALQLEQAAKEDRLSEFYRLWTQKEAITKLLGTGIYQVLDKNTASDFSAYALYSLNPGLDYTASLAVNKPVKRIIYQLATP